MNTIKFLLFSCLFLLANPATAQEGFTIPPITDFLFEEDYEIALAKSAAADEVSSMATILVLKQTGYETVVNGNNGITCYVVRSWGRPMYFEEDEVNYRPSYLVPECLDPNAISVILPMQHFRTALAIKRTPATEINRLMREAFAAGRFQRTETMSVSYMMSNEMRFSDQSKGTPHIMIYLPDDYNNTTVGIVSPQGPNGFFIEGGPNHPYTAAVIYRPEYGIDLEIEE